MFGLSYNTMPHHLAVLHHAWNQLRPGGRLVVMDAKLPPGLGGRLIGAALDDARGKGLAVLPFCPFVDAYIKRHREYVELVPADQRQGFGL